MHQRAVLVTAVAPVCIHDQAIPADTNETGVLDTTVDALVEAYGRSRLFEAVMTDAGPCSLHNADHIDGHDLAYIFRFNPAYSWDAVASAPRPKRGGRTPDRRGEAYLKYAATPRTAVRPHPQRHRRAQQVGP